MHIAVDRRLGDVFISCDVCGQECDLPPHLLPGEAFDAFVALHPPTEHDLIGCPDWGAAPRPSA